MITFQDQKDALDVTTAAQINANGVRAITGPVHQTHELEQNQSVYDNLVAHDNYSYKIVRQGATDLENGANLKAAYLDAITATPGGNPLGPYNRMAVCLPPGNYDFDTDGMEMTTEYVDLVGMGGGPREVRITSAMNTNTSKGTIYPSADNVILKNLTLRNTAYTYTGALTDDAAYAPQGAYPNQVLEDVLFEDCPFDGANFGLITNRSVPYSGTYIRCAKYDFSNTNALAPVFNSASGTFIDCYFPYDVGFGGENGYSAAGTFTRCHVGAGFGYDSTASGTFVDCRTAAGFGHNLTGAGVADGTFVNCVADSVGWTGICSGSFENCHVTGGAGFGWLDSAVACSGTFINCSAQFGFGWSTAGASFTNCRVQDNGFGYTSGTGRSLAGRYEKCTAGASSFGATTGVILSGTFVNCSALANSFGGIQTVAGAVLSGTFIGCRGTNNCFGGQSSTLSGTFRDCHGRAQCFGYAASSATVSSLTGQFYNCTATDDAFGKNGVISATARFYHCTGGNLSFGSGANGNADCSGKFYSCYGGTTCWQHPSGAVAEFHNCTAGDNSFGNSSGDVELAGKYVNCTAGDLSFASAAGGSGFTKTLSGTFTGCTAGDQSFGYTETGDTEITGTMVNCVAGDLSYALSRSGASTISGAMHGCLAGTFAFSCGSATSGQNHIISGVMTNCIAGDNSFAYTDNGNSLISGRMIGCQAGDFSFAYGGTGSGIISGYMENCAGGDRSFAGHALGQKRGFFKQCIIRDQATGVVGGDQDDGPLTAAGVMEDCTWVMTAVGVPALYINLGVLGTCAKINGGRYIAGPTATASIAAGATPAFCEITNIITNVDIEDAGAGPNLTDLVPITNATNATIIINASA